MFEDRLTRRDPEGGFDSPRASNPSEYTLFRPSGCPKNQDHLSTSPIARIAARSSILFAQGFSPVAVSSLTGSIGQRYSHTALPNIALFACTPSPASSPASIDVWLIGVLHGGESSGGLPGSRQSSGAPGRGCRVARGDASGRAPPACKAVEGSACGLGVVSDLIGASSLRRGAILAGTRLSGMLCAGCSCSCKLACNLP